MSQSTQVQPKREVLSVATKPQPFVLKSSYEPRGHQPQAIHSLVQGLQNVPSQQVLLGITGSGKTFTMANVIAKYGRPALIMAPNKILAAQLYSEMRELFPDNAVEYFVSYYDYYQPEAYVPSSDTYIEKDAIINDAIDRMRHSATRSLLSRNDVIIVASVSCIYGIGSRESYFEMRIELKRGQEISREHLLRQLVDIQYERNDYDFHRGSFRVRGDVVEIFPADAEKHAIRVELFGDEIEAIRKVDALRGVIEEELSSYSIFPGSHYVAPEEMRARAIKNIRDELRERLSDLETQSKYLERQRLEQRTMYDLEMLEQIGFCNGIENYSRHLSGRKEGEPAPTLLDYFPNDFLLVIDESHQTLPQVGAMYRGDRARKSTLVEFGFRLPSALDNRPLKFEEFERYLNHVVFVSATPGESEIVRAGGVVVEQLIRPTGLLDPEVEVRPVRGQVDDLLIEIRKRIEADERVLVTTLTKRMAEDLTEYYSELDVKVKYLHSDVETLERVNLLRDLRRGEFDVLVGINLLREGLDLPEVSLVAILDADKEGFLRSSRSLIQTIGRAARNSKGRVIMYADQMTDAMRQSIDETRRRRTIQTAYNQEHGITPATVKKAIWSMDQAVEEADYVRVPKTSSKQKSEEMPLEERMEWLREQMTIAAESLEFERAAQLRDELHALQRSVKGESAPSAKKTEGVYANNSGASAYGGRMTQDSKASAKPQQRRGSQSRAKKKR